ncbi:MAG: Fe-S cluster assembly ATPase SufC [Candidatus Dojkabacteria bacterium]|uniref:Fe-S cluster assembly ATPase SufC n=1 Tax=Candidatus Dojkabacteria bacterium TaxID=2099670 RepID=A0A952AL66_9BACT|nr:Fe-S cluster assembly ATPase SufC [Candidatus Dojkabacteria bacterium]WKZ27838.1 MAG: Fe-S cluster assembly ATPase SufC [Candidatus Dojkabacteria bacterium]
MLKITNLHASVEGNKILNGVNLSLPAGEIHVLMGPNGSGKSTLAKALSGHPFLEIETGKIELDNFDITDAEPDERSLQGLFMAFQYPTEIPGVNYSNFLRMAYNARLPKDKKLPVFAFRKLLKEKAALLELDEKMLDRNLNEGLSGGEKKKSEILQLAVLEPKYAILDETDSGLDVDALKTVFNGVKKIQELQKRMGVLIITHYQRIFEIISPDKVHVMRNGQIVESGDLDIVERINQKGYKTI